MFAAEFISYQHTNAFSKLVVDYVNGTESLHSFYSFPPTIEGIKSAIQQKNSSPIDRNLLVEVLTDQYKEHTPSKSVAANIQAFVSPTTFTVCTAHQPNLLTGPLYFIYKILHVIKLASQLNNELPHYHFVPVYYMGCEDADLQELNHFTVQGKKYVWDTTQKGAVGRMKIDDSLTNLLTELEGQLGVEPFGKELTALFRSCYSQDTLIQDATAKLVHHLFERYGLVILNPDNSRLKAKAITLFEEDIFTQVSAGIVTKSSEELNRDYKVQAHPREINLFYLKDDIRQRIIKKGEKFIIHETDIAFTQDELREELRKYPERFSPNVILRGLFQEMILPNVVFIGGGGELAYWLQLKSLFEHFRVPFPVQVLRNSFLIMEKWAQDVLDKKQIYTAEIFMSELDILDKLIERSGKTAQLNGEVEQIKKIYRDIGLTASAVDNTLSKHIAALQTKTLNHLEALEKKMSRAERKKHAAEQLQIQKFKSLLFPKNGLQERVENFGSYYAKLGPAFIDAVLLNSPGLEQKFTVLKESKV